MFRFAVRRGNQPLASCAPCTAVRFAASAATAASSNEELQAAVRNKMRTYWNDGNLFALSAGSLEKYLKMEGISYRENSTKAVLVQQCEDKLVENELKLNSSEKSGGEQTELGEGGAPLLEGIDREMYMSAMRVTPTGLQVFPHQPNPTSADGDSSASSGGGCDLVVARVNTTAFPGFPSSSECYTLAAVQTNDAHRARYAQAMLWGIANLKALQVKGKISVDFGKLLMTLPTPTTTDSGDAVPNKALQTQIHNDEASRQWTSTLSKNSALEAFLVKKGFSKTYDKTNVVEIRSSVDPKPLLDSYTVRGSGPDFRIRLTSVEGKDSSATTEANKKVVYQSTSKELTFTKEGSPLSVVLRDRKPTTTSQPIEAGERFEASIYVTVKPHVGGSTTTDPLFWNKVVEEVYELSQELAEEATQEFVADFGCVVE